MKYLAKVNDIRSIISQIIDRKNGQLDQLNFDTINQIINKENIIDINFNNINNMNNNLREFNENDNIQFINKQIY